ncbi:hypothetical protein [Veillonella parvula]
MDRQAVIDLLGTPKSIEKMHSRETLKYTNLGLKVVTEHNIVITLMGKGARFEKSGLSIDLSMLDFYNFY